MLRGVKTLHEDMGLVHGLLSLSSIVFCECSGHGQETPIARLKLTKLSSCTRPSLSHTYKNNVQVEAISNLSLYDRQFIAPEILLRLLNPDFTLSHYKRVVTYASDMWSVGCILFFMLTGYGPFEEKTTIEIILRIFKTLGTP